MNILINYDYSQYPFTTASYFEMAGKFSKKHKIFRRDNYDEKKIDFVLNVEMTLSLVSLPNIPTVYYEIDNHCIYGKDRHIYDNVDLVLLAQNNFREFYKDYKIAYLPLACWPNFNKRYPQEKQIYDIGLLGNYTYPKRKLLMNMLRQNFKFLEGEAKAGEEYSRKLNQCKLTFNCAMNEDVNMRFFEAQACGRMLLTDYLPAQNEFAEEGKHYIAYKDGVDLVKKVKYYLANEGKREAIAKAGLLNMQKNHTYSHRLDQLCEIVSKTFKIKND